MQQIRIRPACEADAPSISALIRALSEEHIVGEFTAEGVGTFLASVETEAIGALFSQGMEIRVADEAGEIVGVVATRPPNHLHHLFVSDGIRGRGIGRRLWTEALDGIRSAGHCGDITVNSSRFATGLYEKLGFARDGSEDERGGVVTVPMRLRATVSRAAQTGGLGERVRLWGSTVEERARAYPCDELLPPPHETLFRAVRVEADPRTLFRWLCQLRIAPYSYDWIDNFGRTSPRHRTPELEQLDVGQRFMTIFELAAFDSDRHVTLQLRRPGLFPPMVVTYAVLPEGVGACRLVVKLVLARRPGARDGLVRRLAPWLDWIMMRRQLLNLKRLAEGEASASSR